MNDDVDGNRSASEDENSAAEDLSTSEIQRDFDFYSYYEAKQILGRGLASTVRCCVERVTGREFAVKIVDISTEMQSSKEAGKLRDETIGEVQLLKELRGHPTIINMHDYYETDSYLFAVVELAPKGELFDKLTKAVTFSEKRTRRIMRQLFDAVNFMQLRRIVHRDLKLENILCIDDERIVISDFGFATRLGPGQKLTDLFGTPGYLAPEVVRCQMYEDAPGYGLEVDNWALGVIIYMLLTGNAPFYHRNMMRMLRNIQEVYYEFGLEPWDILSPEAKQIVSGLLTKDVGQRLTAGQCLNHPWLVIVSVTPKLTPKVSPSRRFQRGITLVRFLLRLQRIKEINRKVDRHELRKRPFRDRQIRHESEAIVFAVYGHWVNRGYEYSRDMLFANKSRPKKQRN